MPKQRVSPYLTNRLITGGVEAPEEAVMVMVGVAPGIGDPLTVVSIRDMGRPIFLAGAIRAMEGLDTVVGARDLGNAKSCLALVQDRRFYLVCLSLPVKKLRLWYP